MTNQGMLETEGRRTALRAACLHRDGSVEGQENNNDRHVVAVALDV